MTMTEFDTPVFSVRVRARVKLRVRIRIRVWVRDRVQCNYINRGVHIAKVWV